MGANRPKGSHDPPRYPRRRRGTLHPLPRVLHADLRAPVCARRPVSLPRRGLRPDVLRAELADPERATWLLFDDAAQASFPESPIGYVTACPALLPHPDVAPGDGEIQRLYILQGHQGGGRGTALLRTALEWLERDGPRTLWIGVWSENYGAQRFYARHGFEIVGEYSFMVGDHADREFITRRPAAA